MNKTKAGITNFPPSSIEDFLSLCIGEWITLRSFFELSSDANNWHSSDRCILSINLSSVEDKLKEVIIDNTNSSATTRYFLLDGCFMSENSITGQWKLWADGSLELSYQKVLTNEEERERIWFTKPNLRLRSKITLNDDGTLLRAEFYSEIRRVNKGTI
uniref:Chromophore lyase CpcS/CpeS n=1 Tax=Paulinella longichromatophora TaxID=1708747 RepID=A0A2H4ZP36_9EUKA|nr:hypothetical protein PLO_281 [Paulinella longichromatophora]